MYHRKRYEMSSTNLLNPLSKTDSEWSKNCNQKNTDIQPFVNNLFKLLDYKIKYNINKTHFGEYCNRLGQVLIKRS